MAMKLCKDCKHFGDGENKGFEKCFAPQNLKPVDMVRGDVFYRWTHCELHREDGPITSRLVKTCGRAGRWFQPAGSEK
jgi:hypothetical protein